MQEKPSRFKAGGYLLRGSLIIHQAVLSQIDLVEVNGGQHTGQQPAGGIAHGDGDDLVADLTHDKQVKLPERHEGTEHNDHRGLGVTCAAERAGVDLVEAAQHVEGSDPAQKHGTVCNHFRLAVEESEAK